MEGFYIQEVFCIMGTSRVNTMRGESNGGKSRPMKICLVCSPGGHLTQMLRLIDAFKEFDYFFVTYDSEATKSLKNAYLIDSEYLKEAKTAIGFARVLIKTLKKAIKILVKEKPSVIISNGGGEIAVPFCYVGKVLEAKVIFIETLSRITAPSGGGRLVYPIADLFLVQWESLLKSYGKKAKYWGKVI
jgi:UDP-N-acetylglucosamine:LPS N-acetylglucosamine transferase